jgi:hypothetical protein
LDGTPTEGRAEASRERANVFVTDNLTKAADQNAVVDDGVELDTTGALVDHSGAGADRSVHVDRREGIMSDGPAHRQLRNERRNLLSSAHWGMTVGAAAIREGGEECARRDTKEQID